MLLTIATTHPPARDLGFLLHKHPDRVHAFTEPMGTEHVFYPEATGDRRTVALLLEVDPVAHPVRQPTGATSGRPTACAASSSRG